VADSTACYLIDPLAISDWKPLARLFENQDVTKVFHACAEDLEVCRRLTGALPSPLADTQLAAAMAGIGGSMGFQRLVLALLDVEVGKEETRSNWLQRPLSDDQIRYAVADVFYLHQIYPMLIEKLEQLSRYSWLLEDSARQLADLSTEQPRHEYYRRVKLAWKLRTNEQHILRELAAWREDQARAQDVPRNKVVDDGCLWNMARYKPERKDQLAKSGMKPDVIRQHGDTVLALIKEAASAPESAWPQKLDRPLSPDAGQWLKTAKSLVTSRADMLGIPPEILLRKKPLEQLIRVAYFKKGEVPELLEGWRKTEIFEPLLALLDELAAGDSAFD
ncbi:MAG: ribonuclease D, partial [Oceanobacter sp.]